VPRPGLILVLALALFAAGCGGGGSDAEETTGPEGSTTGQAILTQAGLEGCSQSQSTGVGFVGSGLVQSVSYVVAPSCDEKPAVPTTVTALTYNTQDTASQAAAAAQKAQPNAVVITPTVAPYTTTVLVVSGPKAEEYAADIEGALPKGS